AAQLTLDLELADEHQPVRIDEPPQPARRLRVAAERLPRLELDDRGDVADRAHVHPQGERAPIVRVEAPAAGDAAPAPVAGRRVEIQVAVKRAPRPCRYGEAERQRRGEQFGQARGARHVPAQLGHEGTALSPAGTPGWTRDACRP